MTELTTFRFFCDSKDHTVSRQRQGETSPSGWYERGLRFFEVLKTDPSMATAGATHADVPAAAASKPEPQTMSVRELKEELKAGWVNISGMLEKDDLIAAVKKLRERPPPSPPATSPAHPASAAPPTRCLQCGKVDEPKNLKKCGRCVEAGSFTVSYCGAQCQKAAWRGGHKAVCAKPPLSPEEVVDVLAKVLAAGAVEEWREVLKWEGRRDELMDTLSDDDCEACLQTFIYAHKLGRSATGCDALSVVRLEEQRVELLGKMERFRDQGEAMCTLAMALTKHGNMKQQERWFKRARDVGAAHGFFSVEGRACQGLGVLAATQGRHEEGLELLRNALV